MISKNFIKRYLLGTLYSLFSKLESKTVGHHWPIFRLPNLLKMLFGKMKVFFFEFIFSSTNFDTFSRVEILLIFEGKFGGKKTFLGKNIILHAFDGKLAIIFDLKFSNSESCKFAKSCNWQVNVRKTLEVSEKFSSIL